MVVVGGNGDWQQLREEVVRIKMRTAQRYEEGGGRGPNEAQQRALQGALLLLQHYFTADTSTVTKYGLIWCYVDSWHKYRYSKPAPIFRSLALFSHTRTRFEALHHVKRRGLECDTNAGLWLV